MCHAFEEWGFDLGIMLGLLALLCTGQVIALPVCLFAAVAIGIALDRIRGRDVSDEDLPSLVPDH